MSLDGEGSHVATASAGALVPAVAGDLACAAFDALGDNDPYRDTLGEWWSGHRSRAAVLSNAALDELVKIIGHRAAYAKDVRHPHAIGSADRRARGG